MATKTQLEQEVRGLRRDLKKAERRADGWANLLTGMGVAGYDKRLATKFDAGKVLRESELNDLYRTDGFARRIVNVVADEMTREWFTVANDPDNVIVEALNDIRAKTLINRSLRWDRLHGGALAVLLISDGSTDLEKPLNENRMKLLEEIRVYDRWAVQWTSAELYDDPNNPKYGTPEIFTVNPRLGDLGTFRVHETRTLFFDGADLSDTDRQCNQGWGDSVITNAYRQLRSLGSVYNSVETILDDFIQAVLSIENLQDLIAAGKEDLVKKRMQILDMSKSMLNTMLIDTREKYEKSASTVTGLEGVIEKFASALSAVTGIPVPLLMGENPKGLNAAGTSESSIRSFYDMIASLQESKLQPSIERLVSLMQRCKDGPTKGKELKDWAIVFNPLWQPTLKETVETRKAQAETDKIYLDAQVVTPEEIRTSRFGGESYSHEMSLDDAAYEAEKAEAEKRAEEMQRQLAQGGGAEGEEGEEGNEPNNQGE
jgi:phage-related protein (TIGR01555 family)